MAGCCLGRTSIVYRLCWMTGSALSGGCFCEYKLWDEERSLRRGERQVLPDSAVGVFFLLFKSMNIYIYIGEVSFFWIKQTSKNVGRAIQPNSESSGPALAPATTTARRCYVAKPRAEAGEAKPRLFAVPVALLKQISTR